MKARNSVGTTVSPSLRVAVMQPYFFPYCGYYRLLAAAERFVILDCVQFSRRGRVHRCEVPGPSGRMEWLTLPLAHQPRDTLIRDLIFASDAEAEFARRLARHCWATAAPTPEAQALRKALQIGSGTVTDHLEEYLRLAAGLLGLSSEILRSSTFALPAGLRGQDRIIAIARAAGATTYVNSPGGRALYDPAAFAHAGLRLEFLTPWRGERLSVLPALLAGDAAILRAALRAQSTPDSA